MLPTDLVQSSLNVYKLRSSCALTVEMKAGWLPPLVHMTGWESWAPGGGRRAVDCWTVNGGRYALDCGRWTVNGGRWTVCAGLLEGERRNMDGGL